MKSVDFDNTFKSFIVVGIRVAMCMIPLVNQDFFQFMPAWSQVLFSSPVIMGALTAIGLNVLLNGVDPEGSSLAAA